MTSPDKGQEILGHLPWRLFPLPKEQLQPEQRLLCGEEAAESAPDALAVGCGLGETGTAEHQETWVLNPPSLETMSFPFLGHKHVSARITLLILLGCSENRMES